ncbi:hypothetical protein T4D_15272 [Trichinella pseudospiralis]|uniref:Uncharacterized protein n=1 Tax=Trichinella pseudospiralis TaxID=6337 RepID=A0A0V1F800_TRIPS|nr:hypothetical protein T4D_15272 [Trichinella pseudospiralis]
MGLRDRDFDRYNQVCIHILTYFCRNNRNIVIGEIIKINVKHYLIVVDTFIRHFAIRDATLTLNKFPVDSTAMNAEKEWKFWLLQFEDFVQLTVDAGAFHMMLESSFVLVVFRLCLTAATFEYVKDCKSYDEAIAEMNEVILNRRI